MSIESDPEPNAAATWDAEIASRIARFDAGESQTMPASEVFSRLRAIAPGQSGTQRKSEIGHSLDLHGG
jgi:hypothetical protein